MMPVLWIVWMALCVAALPLRGRIGWSVWLGGMSLIVGAWVYG